MVDLRDIMLVSPNTLSKNQNFQKLRYDFVDKRTLTITTISSCHWKTLLSFCLQKERPENTLLTLTVMIIKLYRKTNCAIQSNTINWIFNDIWCYLFIACFDWKIGIFQQTVVRVSGSALEFEGSVQHV